MADSTEKPHVVIVGAGAGGLELAIRLSKSHRRPVNITLVDHSFKHVWKPLLHEAAVGTLNLSENNFNYFSLAKKFNFKFEYGEFIKLDRHKKTITLDQINVDHHALIPPRDIAYDYLVMAIGSLSNDFGIEGVKENCLFLDTFDQAQKFHESFLLEYFYLPKQPDNEVAIAIVGAGATGVELAAELLYASDYAHASHDKGNCDHPLLKIILIESGPRILSMLPEGLALRCHRFLKAKGVQILTNHRVSSVDSENIYTADGLAIPANLKVWSAGIKVASVLKNLDGLATNKINQLIVNDQLQVSGDENIFAIGDCASYTPVGEQHAVPPRAQAAAQQAEYLAKALPKIMTKQAVKPFVYHDHGTIITLSHFKAEGDIKFTDKASIFLRGWWARILYDFLYQAHQALILGYARAYLLSLLNLITFHIKPRLKLH